MADETTICGEDIKKVKYSICTTSLMYDRITDSKENVISEIPIDMSGGSKCDATEVEQKMKSLDSSVRFLREKLRNEETALLLLRKLQRSQLSLAVRSVLTLGSSNVCQNRVSSNVTVTPQSNTAGRMLARQHFTNHILPQKSSAMSSQHTGHLQNEGSCEVVAQSKMPVSRTAALKESNVRPQVTRPPAVVQQTSEQTLAQRQALAKLAIRRQLEATLLQVPMPKFSPREMLFIPTLGFYADFVALVGMEEAVTCILSEEDTTELTAEVEKFQPFQCARCQTDFSPLWKPEQEHSVNSVMCEQCAIKSQKKAFRQEHTAHLKAAFYQALQQERQIETGGAVAGAVA